jgi:predicted ATP-binding protein involved in virulence
MLPNTKDLQRYEQLRAQKEAERKAAEAAEKRALYGNIQRNSSAASNFANQGEHGFGQLGNESADLRKQPGDVASRTSRVSRAWQRALVRRTLLWPLVPR